MWLTSSDTLWVSGVDPTNSWYHVPPPASGIGSTHFTVPSEEDWPSASSVCWPSNGRAALVLRKQHFDFVRLFSYSHRLGLSFVMNRLQIYNKARPDRWRLDTDRSSFRTGIG